MLRITCALALALACVACEAPSPALSGRASAGTWAVEYTEADGALLSVWGSAPDDVWAAGGQAGRGLVLHFDGAGWKPVAVEAPSLLWWIYGFGRDDVYAVGEGGLIQHFDGSTWRQIPSGTTKTLYGLWGRAGDDVWIVGGVPGGAAGDAVLLRGNASGFHEVPNVPVGLLPEALFKVYGMPTGGLVVVGSGGVVLRFDGSWKRHDVPMDGPLISLWGRGDGELYAVGGNSQGVLLHYDGANWAQVAGVEEGPSLYGVYTAPGEPVYAVGAGARVLELEPSGALLEQFAPEMDSTSVLHSVWGDGHGTVYAVGGSLFSYPSPMNGVVMARR